MRITSYFILLCLLATGCDRNGGQTDITDYMSVYEELLPDIIWEDVSFADRHSRMPLFRNFIVSDLQVNPASLPAFSASISDEISNTKSTIGILHLLHKLNSVSAGGYGPPVSGAGRWKRGRSSSGRISDDFQRFAAEPNEGGIGLIITEKAEKELMALGEEPVRLISDLLDLVSLLIRATSCFADIDAFSELRSSDPLFRILETTELLKVPFRDSELYSNLHRRFYDSVDPDIIALGSRMILLPLQSRANCDIRFLTSSGKTLIFRIIITHLIEFGSITRSLQSFLYKWRYFSMSGIFKRPIKT